jgi:SecD/SecF fusion protein
MDKNSFWKWLILVVLVTFSIILVVPPKDKIRYGLDLQGGTSFVVEIDKEKLREQVQNDAEPDASEAEIDAEVAIRLEGAAGNAEEILRNRIDPDGRKEPVIYAGKKNRIVVQIAGTDAAERKESERMIKEVAFLEFRLVHKSNGKLADALFRDNKAPEGFHIIRIGERSFYSPDRNSTLDTADAAYRKRLGRFGVPSSGYEFMLEKRTIDARTVYDPNFVKIRREMTGEYIKSASAGTDPMKGHVVNIAFDAEGRRLFAELTRSYSPGGDRNPDVNNTVQLAIVLDGVLHSAPSLREPIYRGEAQISGGFKSLANARFLAKVLKAGALPVPVKIVDQRFVAASLGEDSINSGIRAVIYGGVGILLFMLLYYLTCGVVADLALLLNMLLLPLGMAAAAGILGMLAKVPSSGNMAQLPVLTLPGIAGILLTIGMAVDANVLIFERIREEFTTGKRVWTAISAGYDRAFVTIMDANITTLLTGAILFLFGSGPIRGFAITLCAGIMASMFTALVVTKLFFRVLVSTGLMKSVKMLSLIGKTAVDFVSYRKMAAIASLIVIVGTCGVGAANWLDNPRKVFGVDFLGGTALTFKYNRADMPIDDFEAKFPVDEVDMAVRGAGIQEALIQYQRTMDSSTGYLQIRTGSDAIDGKRPSELTEETLQAAFPEAEFSLAMEDDVGNQVGSELKWSAILSIALALLGIIVYLSWRFELGFALGAIAALTHDVLATVGIYVATGHQLKLPIIAALLTIVGYSVNDTIVVFDRIREDLRLVRNKDFTEICNLSINQTLSRTVLTSMTTLLTVVMLLVFGGGAIFEFALALCIGVVVGTYSSIFVATPVVLAWYRGRKPEFASK